MTARIISGTETAKQVRERIAQDVVKLRETKGVTPGLVTILVGNNPASVSYVTGKQRTAKELGFYSVQDDQPDNISEDDLVQLIGRYNRDPKIHGILVQLPLPQHIDETRVLNAIDPDKDVDGLHPMNLGRLMIGQARFYPCTPFGIRELLAIAGVETKGAEVVVVGRSNLVGKPISMMLVQKEAGANATVTMCHTATRDLAAHTRTADILIVAAGRAKAITADMVKDGAVVIDVGVNRIGMTAEGKAKLCGDVDFETVKEKASIITPVPGGVGPMTITMLMQNTLKAAQLAAEG
ncbi:MAG: bifunctional methylenetetrahydrofolate dehydrogenase/methenyltetrahydrofolate cyclohydrolase FolD [Syntrophorhabdaceae bacterium]|nr:bifunctional methylenetetrahydrofolate dehydrogenase/methenyltetrahydrofolate cyclohydrolase FolD [Syntrophorhabdaceae bacterium]